ncbi:uncharacterized protein B0H18DRAFT_1028214 [Fomitopsis serialis]|uniref:uncharacterized protein n=1 Tax=Fomitopsis serialis TaxID=139415 RepID=UPI002008E5E5|nr:uncharacterized protein B0H18DRAFT_1028214 [Neoantrodia serialis]KAH9919296.1 hypothetical protein B0H18DRAFT_1028214 [Neoantrodia serialis]
MEALEQFKNERIEYVHAVVEHAEKCTRWLSDFETYVDNARQERVEQYYTRIVWRFRELGYEDQDIHVMRSRPESMRDRDVTERVWKRTRPVLQPYIDIARCKRLDKSEATIIESRKALVNRVYDKYKRTLRPMESVYGPPYELIHAIPAFRSLIYTSLDVPLQEAACDETAQRLPEYIAAFKDRLKRRLTRCMLGAGASTTPRPTDSEGRLGLAISVFVLKTMNKWHNHVCFGLKDVAVHLATYPHVSPYPYDTAFWVAMSESEGMESGDTILYHSRPGSTVVECLLSKVGLDPNIARPEDLDRLDRRFLCERCSYSNWSPRMPLDLAYTWRNAATHGIRIHTQGNERPAWRVLDGEEHIVVRRAEQFNGQNRDQLWSCNHCPVHRGYPRSRQAILRHARSDHHIAEPQEDIDFFDTYPEARYGGSTVSLSQSFADAANAMPVCILPALAG